MFPYFLVIRLRPETLSELRSLCGFDFFKVSGTVLVSVCLNDTLDHKFPKKRMHKKLQRFVCPVLLISWSLWYSTTLNYDNSGFQEP